MNESQLKKIEDLMQDISNLQVLGYYQQADKAKVYLVDNYGELMIECIKELSLRGD